MTKNDTINSALLTLGAFFVGVVPATWASNAWLAVVSAVIGIVCFVSYELLP